MSDEIQVLHAEIVPGSLQSNLAALSEQCEAMAAEYAGIREIGTYDEYQQAKRDRAALNRAVKQVEDERKRVKREYLKPLDAFESLVKSTIEPLTDVQAKQAQLVRDYEERGRVLKRERLEAYWEQKVPALALCTGEAADPFVPFSRVFDPDWVKRVSELGSDVRAQQDMDALAERLAEGEQMIADAFEGDQCLIDSATMTMYRTLDPVRAVSEAREEQRRKTDMQRLREAREAMFNAAWTEVEPEPELERITASGRMVEVLAEPEPARDPVLSAHRVVVECPNEMELDRLKRVLAVSGFTDYTVEEMWS